MTRGITPAGDSWYCADEGGRKAVPEVVARHAAAGREACAKVCEAMCGDHLPHECAAAVRARPGVPGLQIHRPGGRPG